MTKRLGIVTVSRQAIADLGSVTAGLESMPTSQWPAATIQEIGRRMLAADARIVAIFESKSAFVSDSVLLKVASPRLKIVPEGTDIPRVSLEVLK
jgi:hypothetical protein